MKQLGQLDVVAAWLRHATEPLSGQFVARVARSLDECGLAAVAGGGGRPRVRDLLREADGVFFDIFEDEETVPAAVGEEVEATGRNEEGTRRKCDAAGRDDDGTRHHCEATGCEDDGARHQSAATGRDDDGTRHHCDATGRYDDGTRHHTDATGRNEDGTRRHRHHCEATGC